MKVTYKGVEIESVSTDEILKVVRGLQRSAGESQTIINKVGRPKKYSHVDWTEEEINFVISNIDQPAQFIKKNFPFHTHTKNAVLAKYYAIKNRNGRKMGLKTRELLHV